MNQIPNIEETHNTREVEEIVEKMLAIGWDSKLKKHDGTSIVVSFTKAELCDLLLSIEETHHHQLQKARYEGLREVIKVRKDMTKSTRELFDLIDRLESELEQDKV